MTASSSKSWNAKLQAARDLAALDVDDAETRAETIDGKWDHSINVAAALSALEILDRARAANRLRIHGRRRRWIS